MVGKPLFDILSKLPSKSLLPFRCVSKLWREYIDDNYFVYVHDKQVNEDPTPIIFSLNESELAKTLCFHTIEYDTIYNHVLKAKNKVSVFELVVKKPLSRTSKTKFRGSCNGLVLIETDDLMATFTVIHPMNKQCCVLPRLLLHSIRESYGLGFDSSTNTFKMVFVYINPNSPYTHCTMVHVIGTNSWYKIPQVPSDQISGNAIFAHGCLYWLARYSGKDGAKQVIWFDVRKEEFGLIKPPMTVNKLSKTELNNPLGNHLVNLDGEVGYFGNKTTEVWVLNHKKEWALHCNSEDHDFPVGYIEVLGCLNKAGNIIIKLTNWGRGKEMFYIYNLKNRVIHEARIDGLGLEDGSVTDIVMFPNCLLDIITNSNLFKKRA